MIIKVLTVVALMAVAQIIPDCSGGGERGGESRPDVIGWVDEKRTGIRETNVYLVVINQAEYGVPYDFWRSVNAGDLVKYEGGVWTIVRKAR